MQFISRNPYKVASTFAHLKWANSPVIAANISADTLTYIVRTRGGVLTRITDDYRTGTSYARKVGYYGSNGAIYNFDNNTQTNINSLISLL